MKRCARNGLPVPTQEILRPAKPTLASVVAGRRSKQRHGAREAPIVLHRVDALSGVKQNRPRAERIDAQSSRNREREREIRRRGIHRFQ